MATRKHSKPVNIREINIKFSTEEQCLEYVEQMRWPDGIVRCPTCGSTNVKKVRRGSTSKNKRPWFYLCLEKTCHQQFSPTAGTLFADSHLPLIVWFHAIGLILNAKKGISAMQLQRDLGIGGYKTAWYLNHRIREAMQESNPQPLGGIVEIDETYVGGKQKGKGVYYGKKQKQTVMGAVQRGGHLRLRHIPNGKLATVKGFISEHVGPETERIMTDQANIYPFALAGHPANSRNCESHNRRIRSRRRDNERYRIRVLTAQARNHRAVSQALRKTSFQVSARV